MVSPYHEEFNDKRPNNQKQFKQKLSENCSSSRISPNAASNATSHAIQRSRNLRVRQPNDPKDLVNDIYGVVEDGNLGMAGGTEVNICHGNSGNNELREFLTDSHHTMKNSKQNTSNGSKSLKRSNSSSGRIGNGNNTFE